MDGEEQVQRTVIYRSLHSAPRLGGLPVHYAFVLAVVAVLCGFGLMSVSKVIGLSIAATVAVVWAVLAMIFARDRVQIPLFFLGLRRRQPKRVTSYSQSYITVRVEE